MHSLRRAATHANLTRAVSSATLTAPKAQSISFALRSYNAVRCFSFVTPRAFSHSSPRRDEEQRTRGGGASQKTEPPPSEHCLFVQNYPFTVSAQEINQAFSKFGEVLKVHQPVNKSFCFLYYATAEAAEAAVDNVDGTFWHGRRLVVKISEPRGRSVKGNVYDGPPTNTLYIGNISYQATDAELNQLFSVLENVSDIRVAVDQSTGWPRGFAHAEFHTVEDAMKGMEAIQGKMLRDRDIICKWAENRKPDFQNNRKTGAPPTQEEIDANKAPFDL